MILEGTWPTLPRQGEVHVWLADLARCRPARAVWRYLSPNERRRARRYLRAEDRRRFMLGRAGLRWLLSRYLKRVPRDIDLCVDQRGKPYLANAPDLTFNLSHSHAFVVYTCAPGVAVGVDVQFLDYCVDVDRMAQRFFSKRERMELTMYEGDERRKAFFRGWVRKEAFVKAMGQGLSFGVDDVDVTLSRSGGLVAVHNESVDVRCWTMRDIPVGSDYVAAVAAAGPIDRLRVGELRLPPPA